MPQLCFVLMPFGKKLAGDSRQVDFDAVYEHLIRPAVKAAGMDPLRADEELVGGVIHKAMFERLILCEFAVADLTTANANVFYELGVRHAARPWATQLMFANGWGQLPFDMALLRALPYGLTPAGVPSDPSGDGAALTKRLNAARNAVHDSPVFQLVDGFPDVQRLKTDVFRDRVRHVEAFKSKLAAARSSGVDAVAAVELELADLRDADVAVVIDLFLSYRAVKAWQQMIDLVLKMSPPLAATVMVREQLALALNRIGRDVEAERVVRDVLAQRGPSSETYGILGRILKDRWERVSKAGNSALAVGILDTAIAAYLKGFETDWRDAYPGVNTVTLMELREPPDPRQAELLPIVTYAVERRIAEGQPDYWDFATRLELAVLARNQVASEAALTKALASMREKWEGESTARNLRLVRESRAKRGENVAWLERIELALG